MNDLVLTILPPKTPALSDQWQVWLQLEEGDPTRMHESFIIGTGPTQDAARADAVRTLERAVFDIHAL